mgnify:CR=1 FL=1
MNKHSWVVKADWGNFPPELFTFKWQADRRADELNSSHEDKHRMVVYSVEEIGLCNNGFHYEDNQGNCHECGAPINK